ncbi:MAG TPA: RNA-binding protein [Patescibacteria group bacterium]|nr:RNA-binding protein [Patescibacteria group bacterium]
MNNKRLFVAGLPFETTEAELKDLFSKVGVVVSASIIIDKFSGRSKGFGFVEMTTDEEAQNAIKTLNETDFGGRRLVVAEAKPQEKRDYSGGGDNRRGGGFGGGRGDSRGGGRSGFGGGGRDRGDSRGNRGGGYR